MSEEPSSIPSAEAPNENKRDATASIPPRLTPPRGMRVWLIICLALILLVRLVDLTGDHAIDNIVTLILGFIALMSVAVWFTFFSDHASRWRFGLPVLAICGLAGFIFMFRLGEVSGELVPRFRLRWEGDDDESLSQPATAAVDGDAAVDLSPGNSDYPQFLGPNRNLVIDGVRLSRDWTKTPPREMWRRSIGAGWSPFSVVNGFAVTLEQRGERELATCYEVQTGKLRWSHGVEVRHETLLGGIGPRSAVTIEGGRVYAQGATGVIRCLDGATGNEIWTFDLLDHYNVTPQQDMGRIGWGRSGSPLIVDDLVILPSGGALDSPVSLIALNKIDGKIVWEGGTRQIGFASPAVADLLGTRQIVMMGEDAVTSNDLETGELLWEYPWEGNSTTDANCSQACVLPGNRVFISKGYSAGAALLRITGGAGNYEAREVWRNPRVLKTKFTNVAVLDGFVYGLSDGILECVSLENGARRWRRRGGFGHGQLLIVGDSILVQCEYGEVALVAADPERFRELGRIAAISGKTWNNLCFASPFLLVRNGAEAACFQLPLTSNEKRP